MPPRPDGVLRTTIPALPCLCMLLALLATFSVVAFKEALSETTNVRFRINDFSSRGSRNLLFFGNSLFGNRDGLVEQSLEHDSLTRYFLEYQPDNFQQGGSSSALVILLHGGTQSMYTVFNANNRGSRRWLELSQENGFLLLAPNGVGTGWFGIGKQTKGSANWNDLRDFGSSEDDVGFLVKLIEWAVSERNVDPSRVYFTGASNGGMMTYRMLMERPDVVAAGAALIANLPGEEIVFAPPTIPTPIFLMNGSEDPTVPFEGGVVGRNRGTVRSSMATRDYFVQVNAADPVPVEEILPDLDPNDGCRITSELYVSDTAPVQYYVMEGGGHNYASIPTNAPSFLVDLLNRWILGNSCRDAETADLAWDFVSQFAL